MKKIALTLFILLSVSQFLHAQWTTNGNATYTSNNIGIGTTTPSYQFQLYNATGRSTNNGAYADFGLDSYNNTSWQGSRLYFGRARGNVTTPLAVQNGDFIGWLDFYGHDGTAVQRSGQLVFKVDGAPSSGIVPGAFVFSTAGSDGVVAERMRISSNGSVGIGTSNLISAFQLGSVQYKFSVGKADGPNLNYGTTYMGFNAARSVGAWSTATWTVEGDGYHNGGGVIYSDISGTVSIVPIASNGTSTQTLADADIKSKVAFRVSGTGNVGVGVTDNSNWNLAGSTYKLAIGGGVIATAVTVKLAANWPDYVFKRDYTLPSLTDVKAYIDQNHHLPEIPSQQEVAKEGVNLGDMNKLLLKKVEELTLYLIAEHNEKEDMLKKDIKQQQAIIELNARLSTLEQTLKNLKAN